MLTNTINYLTEVINKKCLELIPLANKPEHEVEFNNKYYVIGQLKLMVDKLERSDNE